MSDLTEKMTVIRETRETYERLRIAEKRIAELEAQLEELRKQEPVAWIHPNIDYRLVSLVRWSDDCLPLYAAPMPPTPSQQEAGK